jgi:F-box/leucine-rich repeat protein 2/20
MSLEEDEWLVTRPTINVALVCAQWSKLLAAECQKISTLNLTYCTEITDAGLAYLLTKCPKIATLNLKYCRQITDIGLASLASSCHNIATLDVGHCNITDIGLKSLAAGCQQITNLNLKCCRQITDIGLAYLLTKCPKIATLNLSYCKKITCDIVGSVSVWPEMISLNLCSCSAITFTGFCNLATMCPHMQKLSLALCGQIRDNWITKLMPVPNLQSLNLDFCNEITDNTLIFLCKQVVGLTYLGHYACLKITDVGMHALAAKGTTRPSDQKSYLN